MSVEVVDGITTKLPLAGRGKKSELLLFLLCLFFLKTNVRHGLMPVSTIYVLFLTFFHTFIFAKFSFMPILFHFNDLAQIKKVAKRLSCEAPEAPVASVL